MRLARGAATLLFTFALVIGLTACFPEPSSVDSDQVTRETPAATEDVGTYSPTPMSVPNDRTPPPTEGAATSPSAENPAPFPPKDENPVDEWPTFETINCDSMLREPARDTLRAQGLIPAPKPWDAFEFVGSGPALACPWGYEGTLELRAFYAWVQLLPGEAERFAALVTETGSSFEETSRGRWVVVPPESRSGQESAILVTDEWVALALTREDIDDIVWAR